MKPANNDAKYAMAVTYSLGYLDVLAAASATMEEREGARLAGEAIRTYMDAVQIRATEGANKKEQP